MAEKKVIKKATVADLRKELQKQDRLIKKLEAQVVEAQDNAGY